MKTPIPFIIALNSLGSIWPLLSVSNCLNIVAAADCPLGEPKPGCFIPSIPPSEYKPSKRSFIDVNLFSAPNNTFSNFCTALRPPLPLGYHSNKISTAFLISISVLCNASTHASTGKSNVAKRFAKR